MRVTCSIRAPIFEAVKEGAAAVADREVLRAELLQREPPVCLLELLRAEVLAAVARLFCPRDSEKVLERIIVPKGTWTIRLDTLPASPTPITSGGSIKMAQRLEPLTPAVFESMQMQHVTGSFQG